MERKLFKIALVVASSLLLSFSAFADDGEASDLPIEEVTHDIELVNDSSLEASDISNENLAEILSGPLRSPSINPNVDFQFLGFDTVDNGDNTYGVSILFTGTISDGQSFRVVASNNVPHYGNGNNNYIASSYPYNSSVNSIDLVDGYGVIRSLWTGSYLVTSENVGGGIGQETLGISTYLSFVQEVFTWLLTTIGSLITFIMGNPFLAVSLFLFLAGTVISFFIRIKNA